MVAALKVVEAEVVRTADEWAEVIKSDLNRAVEGIVSAGKNLIAAKAEVKHGEWLPMLKQIGISQSDARKLMAVSRTFANRSNLNDLPSSMTALYELSRLSVEDIEDGISSGYIHSGMTIKDAKEIVTRRKDVQPSPGELPQGPPPDKSDERIESVKLDPRSKRQIRNLDGINTSLRGVVIALDAAITNGWEPTLTPDLASGYAREFQSSVKVIAGYIKQLQDRGKETLS